MKESQDPQKTKQEHADPGDRDRFAEDKLQLGNGPLHQRKFIPQDIAIMPQVVRGNPRVEDIGIVTVKIADIPLVLGLPPEVDAGEIGGEDFPMGGNAGEQGEEQYEDVVRTVIERSYHLFNRAL